MAVGVVGGEGAGVAEGVGVVEDGVVGEGAGAGVVIGDSGMGAVGVQAPNNRDNISPRHSNTHNLALINHHTLTCKPLNSNINTGEIIVNCQFAIAAWIANLSVEKRRVVQLIIARKI